MAKRWRNCDYCYENYAYERTSSRYCSTSCRVGLHKRGERMAQMLEKTANLFQAMHEIIDAHPGALIDGKYLEATAHLVVESANLDQHLLRATSKGISRNILIEFHE